MIGNSWPGEKPEIQGKTLLSRANIKCKVVTNIVSFPLTQFSVLDVK